MTEQKGGINSKRSRGGDKGGPSAVSVHGVNGCCWLSAVSVPGVNGCCWLYAWGRQVCAPVYAYCWG